MDTFTYKGFSIRIYDSFAGFGGTFVHIQSEQEFSTSGWRSRDNCKKYIKREIDKIMRYESEGK